MSQALPLHLALILIPYLEPADIARAQQVCKVRPPPPPNYIPLLHS